jgi:PhnB protein
MSAQTTALSSLTPHLAVRDGLKAIEFYKDVFGATEVFRLLHPETGVLCHAQLTINGSQIMMAEEHPDYSKSPRTLGGTTVRLCLTVDDVDTVMARAQKAGATITVPAADQFYGQRSGSVRDPFGHEWMLQHEFEKVEHAEMKRRFIEMVKKS